MVPNIVDNKAHVNYILVHRHLIFAIDFRGIPYHFEASMMDGSPRFRFKEGSLCPQCIILIYILN